MDAPPLRSKQRSRHKKRKAAPNRQSKVEVEPEVDEEESSEEEIDPDTLRNLFTPPSMDVRLAAIGQIQRPGAKDYWFDPGDDFADVPQPNHRDDYLAQNNVRGQSFAKWMDINYTPVTPIKPTIYLVPVGKFPETQNLHFHFLESLRRFTSAYYLGMQVAVLPPVTLSFEGGDEEEVEDDNWTDFASMTCNTLRAELRKRGLSTAGLKKDLIARLQQESGDEDFERKMAEDSQTRRRRRAFLEYTPPDGQGRKRREEIVVRRAHEYDMDDALPDARQLYISPVCEFLVTIKPKDARCLIGVTMEDLYCSNDDSFTMGLAYSGRVGVFSFGRYHPGKVWKQSELEEKQRKQRRGRGKRRKVADSEEDEETKNKQDLYVLLNRSCKVLVHEIGHLFGIGHCIYWNCCMNGSGHLQEDYRQAMHLCPVDLHKLQHCLGFDVEQRYRRMAAFYRKHLQGFEPELEWIQQRLKYLEARRKEEEGEEGEKEKEKDDDVLETVVL